MYQRMNDFELKIKANQEYTILKPQLLLGFLFKMYAIETQALETILLNEKARLQHLATKTRF